MLYYACTADMHIIRIAIFQTLKCKKNHSTLPQLVLHIAAFCPIVLHIGCLLPNRSSHRLPIAQSLPTNHTYCDRSHPFIVAHCHTRHASGIIHPTMETVLVYFIYWQ